MKVKPFYKSKTVIIFFLFFVSVLLDAVLGTDIYNTINERLNGIFVDNGDDIVTKIDFNALLAAIVAIVMRLVSKDELTKTKKEAEQKDYLPINPKEKPFIVNNLRVHNLQVAEQVQAQIEAEKNNKK